MRLNMRQCWSAVSLANHLWRGLRDFSGPQYFTALLWRSSHFAYIVFVCACAKAFLLPALSSLCFGLVKYLKTFYWGSHCDGGWWLPLTCLSWLPSRLLAAPSVYSGTFPTLRVSWKQRLVRPPTEWLNFID